MKSKLIAICRGEEKVQTASEEELFEYYKRVDNLLAWLDTNTSEEEMAEIMLQLEHLFEWGQDFAKNHIDCSQAIGSFWMVGIIELLELEVQFVKPV